LNYHWWGRLLLVVLVAFNYCRLKQNTITMMAATSVAAAVAASQRQTLPPLGWTLSTPPVKKNGIP
jgi:hypothetical protein